MVEYNRQPDFDNKSYWKGREDERNNGDHSHYLLDEAVKEIESLKQRAEQAEEERDKLQGIVDKLPKTKDGMVTYADGKVWLYQEAMDKLSKLQSIVDELKKREEFLSASPDEYSDNELGFLRSLLSNAAAEAAKEGESCEEE